MANASHSSTGIGSTGLTGSDAAIDGSTAITWRSGSGGIDEMAYSRSTAEDTDSTHDPVVDRCEALETGVPAAQAPRADEVSGQAVPVAIDGHLTPDGKFRWSAGWGMWCPTGKGDPDDLPGPLEWGPLMPERLHPRGCWCIDCWNTGLRYADYAKAKRVRETSGF